MELTTNQAKKVVRKLEQEQKKIIKIIAKWLLENNVYICSLSIFYISILHKQILQVGTPLNRIICFGKCKSDGDRKKAE